MKNGSTTNIIDLKPLSKKFTSVFVNAIWFAGVTFGGLLPEPSIAAEQCDLEGRTVSLSIQLCLEIDGENNCYDEFETYKLDFIENKIRMFHSEGVSVVFEVGRPDKNILADKEHAEFIDHIQQIHRPNQYTKYIIGANRTGNSVHLSEDNDWVIGGRWQASTRTDYWLNITENCRKCRLTNFSSVTNKNGYSPNIQVAGESKCVLE